MPKLSLTKQGKVHGDDIASKNKFYHFTNFPKRAAGVQRHLINIRIIFLPTIVDDYIYDIYGGKAFITGWSAYIHWKHF